MTGPAHGRIIGACWVKTVRASVHMLKLPRPAWAVDLSDLQAAEQAGATELELREQERGVIYRVTLETLKTKGQVLDRGFGRQVFLPLGCWCVSGGGGEVAPAAKVEMRQLSLFEAAR